MAYVMQWLMDPPLEDELAKNGWTSGRWGTVAFGHFTEDAGLADAMQADGNWSMTPFLWDDDANEL
jgi:hypothetical protein